MGRVQQTRILLVDDTKAVLDRVSAMLAQNERFEVVGAVSDGSTALAECLRLRPDIVILDISMGEVCGIDVARKLRDAGCYCKIIFLTVHEDIDFKTAALAAGGSAYVVKPHLGKDLILAINAVLSDKLFISGAVSVLQY
jgi:DNA-binding NarL/FixJ family response regulator